MQEGTLTNTLDQGKAPTSAVVIANPTAGSYEQSGGQMQEALAFLRAHGWHVELQLTQAAGDASRLAREAVANKRDVVIAVGGDGTINEIIQELANSETALGVLPSGTVNVWAREIGVPMENAGALLALTTGVTRRVDLGRVGDRYFLLMAGIGFDGEVTRAVEQKPVKRLGVLGYLLIGTWLGLGYSGFRTSLQIDGRIIRANALQVIIGNTQLYGGAIKYTWQAKCDDGLLDVCIVYKQNLWGRVALFLDFLLRREQRHQWIRYERGKSIRVRTRFPAAIQIDGDPVGNTSSGFPPTIFTIAPDALKVIVPQQAPQALFSQESASIEEL